MFRSDKSSLGYSSLVFVLTLAMLFSLLISFFLCIQSGINGRYVLVKTMPEEKADSSSMTARAGFEGCCDQLTLTSEGVTLHVPNKDLLGNYVKNGFINGRVSYRKTKKDVLSSDGDKDYAYVFIDPKGDWLISDRKNKGTSRGFIHLLKENCNTECPRSCRGGRVADDGWKGDPSLRFRCACENLEAFCVESKPNCGQEYTKRMCRKYYGLCDEPCEDKETWCKSAQPNCNTTFAKENCKEYCGLCANTYSTTLLPN